MLLFIINPSCCEFQYYICFAKYFYLNFIKFFFLLYVNLLRRFSRLPHYYSKEHCIETTTKKSHNIKHIDHEDNKNNASNNLFPHLSSIILSMT